MSTVIGMEGPTGSFAPDEENLGFRLALRHSPVEIRAYPRVRREDAIANARRLVEEDGAFLLLNFGGPASLAIAMLANQQGVPYLFPHTGLLPRWPGRNVFTSFPRYEGEATVMKRYLNAAGVERIAVLHAANAYGMQFAQALGTAGTRAVADEHPASLADEVRELRDGGAPQALVLALYPEQARKAIEGKATLGWRDVRLVSAGPLTDEQFIDVPGGHAEGTLGFCYYPDPRHSAEPGMDAYRAAMAQAHPGHPLNRYSLYGYVFGLLTLEALRREGARANRQALVQAMESISNWDSGGILPPVSFSKTQHHAQEAGMICELRGGRFQPLTGWIAP